MIALDPAADEEWQIVRGGVPGVEGAWRFLSLSLKAGELPNLTRDDFVKAFTARLRFRLRCIGLEIDQARQGPGWDRMSRFETWEE